MPHYGHILAGTIKDIVTRYAHQTGHYVERRFGWDCHGLPVEFEIDKKLEIKGRADVMKMGIPAYNKECRSIVTRYCSEWERIVNRMGRWIDFKNDYKTLEPWYMESVWWVFKTMFDKGLVYRGQKVMPYSTACNTPISNFEANLNYKDVKDPAVTVSFPLDDDPSVSVLAWTTTPWTLPSNLGLCVNVKLDYVKIKDKKTGNTWILGKTRLSALGYKQDKKGNFKKEDFEILEEFKGDKLVGKTYKPLFDYFKDHPNSFKIMEDSYVTDDGGTCIVHQAPAFGADDFRVCAANGIVQKGAEIPCPVDPNGCFTDQVPDWKGVHVKEADDGICKALKAAGRLVKKDTLTHSYPFCYRSQTPLIYRTIPSWFINVEAIKDKVVENNKKVRECTLCAPIHTRICAYAYTPIRPYAHTPTHSSALRSPPPPLPPPSPPSCSFFLQTYWEPDFVKSKRFHNWLTDAHDWGVSRNRYWGTPLPLWVNEDFSEVRCIGSIQELKDATGRDDITDIHREHLDDLEIPSANGGPPLRRVDEVFDCWFESGSMPYAQQHYPFENKEKFEKTFPADFIAEGLDQTRGWFYTLMVISTALFDKPAFKNLIVNGLVLAADGKKMSKSLKNYPDPMLVVNKYGADALRLYLINSPVVRAEPLKFQEDGVLRVVKEVFMPWFNVFRFLVQNIRRTELDTGKTFVPDEKAAKASPNLMDQWIQASLQGLLKFVRQEMAAYRLYTVVPRLVSFLEDLTNWYVRLNRTRLKGADTTLADCQVALSCLYCVLLQMAQLMAPFTPFFTEWMYVRMRKIHPNFNAGDSVAVDTIGKAESIHFTILPEYDPSMIDAQKEQQMKTLQTVLELGRKIRERRNLSLKQPVKEMVVVAGSQELLDGLKVLEGYLKEEFNVMNITLTAKESEWCTLQAIPNAKRLGKSLGKAFKAVKIAIGKLSDDDIKGFIASGSIEVGGATLTTEDLTVTREFKGDTKAYEADSAPDNSCMVAVDCREDPAIMASLASREMVNRIQKLRKSSHLQVEDEIVVFFEEKGGDSVTKAVAINTALVQKSCRLLPAPIAIEPAGAVLIAQEETAIGKSKVNVRICRPCMYVAPAAALKKATGCDDATLEMVTNFAASLDYHHWRSEAKDVEVTVGEKKITLRYGKDIFDSASSYLKAFPQPGLDWLSK
jgi:isoleucyl-tRNA synthetase